MPACQSSLISISTALTNRKHDASFGKMLATRVLRRTSRLRFYWGDPLDAVGGPQQAAVWLRKSKHGQALGQSLLHPRCQFRSHDRVLLHCPFEECVGFGPVLGVEDRSNIRRHLRLHVLFGDIGRSVLLEVELAPLPEGAAEHSQSRRLQPFVRVADDQADAAQAAPDQALQELPPVRLLFGQSHRDTQDGALTHFVHAHGNEDGGVLNDAALTHLLVAGVQQQVRAGRKRTLPPGVQHTVEFLSGAADLARGDLEAAKLLGDGGDLTGGDALHIHLR